MTSFSHDAAQTLALKALSWLLESDELRPVFMGSTGVSESDLRTRAAEPEFLASVLDFLLMNDAWIMAFCDASGVAYDQPSAARAALPGGAAVNWT